MADRTRTYENWSKDQDLVLTALGDLGFFDWNDFDDECFSDLDKGEVITPPIAANYAINTQELLVSPTINTSRLWTRDYPKLQVEMSSSTTSTSYANGYLDVQFFPKIKGHYHTILWDFGDGTTTNTHEPNHRFKQYGEESEEKEFEVKIRVDGPNETVEKTGLYITLPGKE